MKCVRLSLLFLGMLASGCTTQSDYMVHFRSVEPFHPKDPNELLAELTGKLPTGVEIRQFLYKQKADEIRGIVLVKGNFGKEAVKFAIRQNPNLRLLQVENAPLFSCLSEGHRIHLRHGNTAGSRNAEAGM